MRIIAGKYKGRNLRSPSDLKIRPTSDRLRESVFNVLTPYISESTRFLDLTAGTGAIGIEALSRGASFCSFVDISRRACSLIEENLDKISVPEEMTEVHNVPAHSFLSKDRNAKWDMIYYDPPYDSDYKPVFFLIGSSNESRLTENGIFMAEHSSIVEMPETFGRLERLRTLKQGASSMSFYGFQE